MCYQRDPRTQCDRGHTFLKEYVDLRCIRAIQGKRCQVTEAYGATTVRPVACRYCWQEDADEYGPDYISRQHSFWLSKKSHLFRCLLEAKDRLWDVRHHNLSVQRNAAYRVKEMEAQVDAAEQIVKAMRQARVTH